MLNTKLEQEETELCKDPPHTHINTKSKQVFNFKNKSIINAFQQTLIAVFYSGLKSKPKNAYFMLET